LRTAKITKMMTPSPSQKYGLMSRTPNKGVPSACLPGGWGMLVKPRSPRRKGRLSAKIRMISANPSVTMAR